MVMDVHGRGLFVMWSVIGRMAVFAVQTGHGRDGGAYSPDSRAVQCVWRHVRIQDFSQGWRV